jgi:hypothetical protein
MLKLTYTESGLRLERLSCSLEDWIAQRVTLTLRAGQKLYIEPSYASFLLAANHSGLSRLKQIIAQEQNEAICLEVVDDSFMEVSLKGSWIAERNDSHEGLFIATFPSAIELCIYKLWQVTQSEVSFMA